MQVTSHIPGKFCWGELCSTDAGAAAAFYGAIFGWSSDKTPMGPDAFYTLFNIEGDQTGGMYEDNSGTRPVCWAAYIRVVSVDDTVTKIQEAGGRVLAGPFDVMTHGRMAMVMDPAGAAFAIWEAKNHIGYGRIDEVGAPCWSELNTRDTETAGKFYSTVFGYGIKKSTEPMEYTEFQIDGKSIAGMLQMSPEMEGVPPHWLTYYLVANCAETVAKVKELGASVPFGPVAIPTVGDIAVVIDPQGAAFGLISG